MPKVNSKKTARKHKQSAKNNRAARTQAAPASVASTSTASTSAANDPSQWRASKLKETDTITKSDAKRLYRLSKVDDYEGIPFRTEQTVGRDVVRPMFIYRERDIERRAWEKHGGPEGFDQYLAKLKVSYLKTHGPDAEFPQPRTYADPYPRISVARLRPSASQSSGPIDLYVRRSPALLNVKNQMVPWLWNAYNHALSLIDDMNDFWDDGMGRIGSHGSFTRTKDRERPMKDALVIMPTYPPRPAESLASSASVDKVRAVLSEAASLPRKKDWGRNDLPGLTILTDEDEEGEPIFKYRWSDDYLERLFNALIEVITEHGTGPEGLEGIRWEVYDKVYVWHFTSFNQNR